MELGSGEIVLVLLAALLIYGGRLPEVARALGRSIGELKRGISETRREVTSALDDAAADPRAGLDHPTREVRRIAPVPPEIAKEDISSPPAPPHEKPN
jgi:sec-independent protein translocase protein TatA